ncbi:MAG: hypothetical protein M3O28_05420 [Actinomycetota bacterium]|nr:hypothetical protein [Actinomycetota bacterium]
MIGALYPGQYSVQTFSVAFTFGVATPTFPTGNLKAFEPGNDIPLAVLFTVGGIPADPPVVSLRIETATGAILRLAWPGPIVRTGPGAFRFDHLPSSSGTCFARWSAPAFEADTGDVEFMVLPSEFS